MIILNKFKESIRSWSVRHMNGPRAKLWLSAISFSEASFFPIPPDVFLIALLLANKARNWFCYSGLTTFFSVLGGVFGYAIGFFFFDVFGESMISFYGLEGQFLYLKTLFASNAFLAIFTAGFTPVPYKVFTITAGFFSLSLPVFIIASVLSRAIRFFAIGFILKIYGEKISNVLYKYFNIFSIFIFLCILIWYVLF